MSKAQVLIYGASGYTGKLIAEALHKRFIPFIFAGRNIERLQSAIEVVEQRVGDSVNAELVVANNTVEELTPLFERVSVVINVAGPFMQIGWPVVEACLASNTHYLDTTGEQDWVLAIKEKFGLAFADKDLVLCPANSFMWAAGALAAEVVLEDESIDMLDILYKPDNGLPSVASTKSFLRMQCNPETQYYLEQNELKSWPNNVAYDVAVPFVNVTEKALPWGGACEPIWYQDDARVRNCKVLTAVGSHMIGGVLQAVEQFNQLSPGMSEEERENLTNQIGDQICQTEPPKDDVDVQRSIIVCNGRGRNSAKQFVLHLAAPYTWTGDICAEGAMRILNKQVKKTGFQSAATAFGHRELLDIFFEAGVTNRPE